MVHLGIGVDLFGRDGATLQFAQTLEESLLGLVAKVLLDGRIRIFAFAHKTVRFEPGVIRVGTDHVKEVEDNCLNHALQYSKLSCVGRRNAAAWSGRSTV